MATRKPKYVQPVPLEPGEALRTVEEGSKVATKGKGAIVLSVEDAKDLYLHRAISREQFAQALRNRRMTPDQIEHEATVCEQQRVMLAGG